MIVRSFNPIEGGPAIWLDQPIQADAQVARLLRQLREYPDAASVDVVIDCPGGNCAAGLGLYSALRDDPRRKRVTIYQAASMAGVVAMAGDEIRIVERGTVFLHGAGYTAENVLNELPGRHMAATALRHLAKRCDALDVLHVSIFARRTGLAPERVAELRATDTTLDAEAAVRLGFADSIIRTET